MLYLAVQCIAFLDATRGPAIDSWLFMEVTGGFEANYGTEDETTNNVRDNL